MTLVLVPDAEKLVSDYLRTHADVVALNTRVVGKSPSSTAQSWIKVTELDSPQVGLPDFLVESMLQVDIYPGETGGQPQVNQMYRTVRAVLGTMTGSHTLGVVSGVRVTGSLRSLDTDLEPARDRRILTVLVWTHR